MAQREARPTDPVGRFLFRAARLLAILGGVLLCALGMTTVVTILLVQFAGVPFVGEVELVSFGMVLTVYLFMPYCQMTGGHVIVDIFTMKAPPRFQAVLDGIASIAFAAFWGLLIWRMSLGMEEMLDRNQTTAALKLAYWWTFPVALACFSLLVPISFYRAWRQLAGRPT